MDLMSGVQAFSAALEVSKKIKAASDSIKNSELICLSADLMSQMADMKLAAVELKTENANLSVEIENLKEKLRDKEEFYFEKKLYWKKLESGKIDGPYCPPCRDSKKGNIRLDVQSDNYLYCHVCKAGINSVIKNSNDYFS